MEKGAKRMRGHIVTSRIADTGGFNSNARSTLFLRYPQGGTNSLALNRRVLELNLSMLPSSMPKPGHEAP